LISLREQRVRVGERSYTFAAFEPIRTEISCKYRTEDVSRFARGAGFVEVEQFFDERRWFVDALWQVPAQ
jgi:L-histidine Nalpha-methyltransferase